MSPASWRDANDMTKPCLWLNSIGQRFPIAPAFIYKTHDLSDFFNSQINIVPYYFCSVRFFIVAGFW